MLISEEANSITTIVVIQKHMMLKFGNRTKIDQKSITKSLSLCTFETKVFKHDC